MFKECQIYAFTVQQSLKSLSSVNKQTIFGYDFHKSDKHFTRGRDYQGYLLTIPVNTFLSIGLIGKKIYHGMLCDLMLNSHSQNYEKCLSLS